MWCAQEVKDVLSKAGTVTKVDLPSDLISGRHKGTTRPSKMRKDVSFSCIQCVIDVEVCIVSLGVILVGRI